MKKWNDADKLNWFNNQETKRSYEALVLSKIENLSSRFVTSEYGQICVADKEYLLFLITNKNIDHKKRNILVTGGVHGYETSGVMGALKFLENLSDKNLSTFNFYVAPCISPWAFETINRWNNFAVDPNRSFLSDGPSLECNLLLKKISSLGIEFLAHFDLHETTDTDNSVFRPALEARDGIKQDLWEIPDGFYLVGDTENICFDFQQAIIKSVERVTHIAPHDSEFRIIGEKISQVGVINYDVKKLFLCTGFSKAKFSTTTEVYPDSPKVDEQNCIDAQVAAINGGLSYLKEYLSIN